MVILCDNTPNMFNASQYVQPDYLTPLPTNLDSKKSPLALLAQTCSQIGADSSATKPSTESKVREETKKSPKTSSPKTEGKPAGVFRPFETSSPKPVDKQDSRSASGTPNTTPKPSNSGKNTPTSVGGSSSVTKSVDSKPVAVTKPEPHNPSTSPIIRSGMEVLQSAHKDLAFSFYRPPIPSQFQTYPGLLPSELAMLRHPYLPGAMGYVPTTSAGSPFVAYPRPRLTSDSMVCRDPFCTGCQLGPSQHFCPIGCTQCDHHKLPLLPTNTLGYPTPAHVCNWIVGNSYCGKRFNTSEELLQHLRTHTAHNLLATSPLPPSRAVSSADLRYHPYGKPQPMLHVPSPSFGALYSPYSFLGGPR